MGLLTGNKTCDKIQPEKECYKPVSLFQHASYAFSSYWADFKKIGGVCSFNGLATTTFKDPSKLPSRLLPIFVCCFSFVFICDTVDSSLPPSDLRLVGPPVRLFRAII